jgi:RNA polymerase sigma-70 factor (ECF subfamily)
MRYHFVKPVFDGRGTVGALPIGEDQPLPPHDPSPGPRRTSLEMLYRAQAPKLLRMFVRRADRDDAHDLVHDSFVQWARLPEEERAKIVNPEAYLNAVSQNVLRSRARAAYHRSIMVQDEDAGDRASVDITAALEARDMLKRLDAAMVKLDPKTREIFMALRLDGATYAEVAKRTGLTVKGVEWHMAKALAALRRAAGDR